jgi:formylglycine-generating enzyme required for sulfatase activity
MFPAAIALGLLGLAAHPAASQSAPPDVPAGIRSARQSDGVWRLDRPLGPQPSFWQTFLDLFSWKPSGALPFRRSVAFVAGVAQYVTLRPQLPYVDTDLTRMRNFLLTRGGFDTVFEVRNSGISRTLIEQYMATKFTRESADLGGADRLLFYYSGHGADNLSRVGYLQFSAAVPENYAGDSILPTREFEDWARVNVAKHLLIILDACSSGLAVRTMGSSSPEAANALSADPSGFLLTAGTADQKAFQLDASNRKGYSVFTDAILRSLQTGFDENKPFMTISEVLGRAQSYVGSFEAEQGQKMTPQIWPLSRRDGLGQGTFVFLNPRARNPAVPPSYSGLIAAKGESDEAAQIHSWLDAASGSDENERSPGTIRRNPKDGLDYVWIPPGEYMMGCSPGDKECRDDERPAHEVEITRGFWMGRTEVTEAAWARFLGGKVAGNPGMPRVGVAWAYANIFCGWAGLRLPTEAEWEYAARAGTTGARYGELDSVAWRSKATTFLVGFPRLRPVAGKQPNAWGLYDMLGNAWEWVADWYDKDYYNQNDSTGPTGPPSGTGHVLRGGAWSEVPKVVRVSYRGWSESATPGVNFGFRCAAGSH